jgi:shikimate kinase
VARLREEPRIIVVGYRGAGKSTVGPIVAARLGWAFLDCDEEVERAAGRSVAELFHVEGEAGFRDRESAALAESCERGRVVIATGGGAVLRETNRALIKEAGFVVWLTAPAGVIHDRLSRDPATAGRRPALTATGGLDEIVALLAVREPLYRAVADLVLDTTYRSPEELAADILSACNFRPE